MKTAVVVAVAVCAISVTGIATASSVRTFGDGTYIVGKTVAPGSYRAPGGSNCYWERDRNFSGGDNSIIANDTPAGPTLTTISPSDKGFQTSGCGRWTSNLSRITKSKTTFGQGEFIVGTDIDPGTYTSRGGSDCYWERDNSFGQGDNSIIANDTPTGTTVVTISPSDKEFASSGCATWKRL
jgi:hypothetical protein